MNECVSVLSEKEYWRAESAPLLRHDPSTFSSAFSRTHGFFFLHFLPISNFSIVFTLGKFPCFPAKVAFTTLDVPSNSGVVLKQFNRCIVPIGLVAVPIIPLLARGVRDRGTR